MKAFVVAICVALSAMSVSADVNMDEWKTALDQCMEQNGIKSYNMTTLLLEDYEKLMCGIACANKKLNLFDGKKFNEELVHEMMQTDLESVEIPYSETMKERMSKCIEMGNDAAAEGECKQQKVVLFCVIELKEDILKD